jgi:ParB family chromosome partitioning protein
MSNHFEVITVTPYEVHVIEGRNPRTALLNIEQLAESIEENGVRNPIKVQPNDEGYELVDGHRRLAACQYLFDTKELVINIPAVVVDHYQDESDVLVEMMVSNDSEPFAPFEEAMLYSRLRDEFDMNNDKIAKRVGKSISHVSDKLALLRADASVKKAVAEKTLSVSDANTVIRKSKGDTEKQKEIVERVEKEGREQVIEKELKKGRMAKPLWERAEIAHDMVWTAMLDVGTDEAESVLDSDDPQKWLEDTQLNNAEAKAQLAFGLGALYVFSNISGLSVRELWDKLEERLMGGKSK